VGIAAVTIQQEPKRVGWTSDDFFVPPSLWGTGLGWLFLDRLLKRLHEDGFTECYVVVKAPLQWEQDERGHRRSPRFIEQYARWDSASGCSGARGDERNKARRIP
jgi:hypothetical protein